MQCPTCKDVQLVMSERKGIELDYCPQCRGIWLDRGELDKIIERSAIEQATPVAPSAPGPAAIDQSWGRSAEHHGKPYRKKSFLSELFD
ncbi:MAG: zf-TFIIB domain-containing protein [Burkholderiaceae bacterium]|nr:zf-TFIIB domain-containing protein [Burkholderiaceae bacterium]